MNSTASNAPIGLNIAMLLPAISGCRPPVEFSSVRQSDFPREHERRPVTRSGPFDADDVALLQIFLRPSGTQQRVWRKALELPGHHLALIVLDAHVDPRMRV